jgi:hypothetical protein
VIRYYKLGRKYYTLCVIRRSVFEVHITVKRGKVSNDVAMVPYSYTHNKQRDGRSIRSCIDPIDRQEVLGGPFLLKAYCHAISHELLDQAHLTAPIIESSLADVRRVRGYFYLHMPQALEFLSFRDAGPVFETH